ncbi:MAG: hypothetical protein AAF770_02020 [Bacteroidota bacterium]
MKKIIIVYNFYITRNYDKKQVEKNIYAGLANLFQSQNDPSLD